MFLFDGPWLAEIAIDVIAGKTPAKLIDREQLNVIKISGHILRR
jgi:hypothetical protein